MKRLLFITVLCMLLVPTIAAHTGEHAETQTEAEHHVDTVVLASTANYPDALVAGSAAAKIGAPVLLTEKDSLTDETQNALNRLDPSEVVIVGGEAVVSADVQQQLASTGYNVTRLWGATRYGTTVEVSEYFWAEGAEEAVLIQNSLEDKHGRVIAAAKELARDESTPVYLTPEGNVPAAVLSSLENLGVREVTAVGTEVSADYRQSLTDIGVEVRTITGQNEEEVTDKVEEETTQDVNASTELLVVASNNSGHHIAAPNLPNHHIVHVSEEGNDVEDIVELVNERGVSKVKVVGQPDLAETVASSLRTDTSAEVRLVTGAASESVRINANLTEESGETFAKQSEKRMQAWKEQRQAHRDHVKTRANKTINKADTLIDENSSEDAQRHLQEARLLYSEEKYFEAMEEAHNALSETRKERLNERSEAARDAMAEEMESLNERVEALRELNQEFAAEMEENMTTEERLAVIEEFRHERRETVRELMKEAREQRAEQQEDIQDRLRDARKRVRDRREHERFRFEAECTDQSAESIQVAESRITGHDGKVSADGTLLLPTPNYDAEASATKSGQTVDMTIDVTQTDGFGIQCVGEAEYRYRVDVAAGNWTVNLDVTSNGRTVHSETRTVTVTPDEDEHENETEVEAEAEVESEDNETTATANVSTSS